MSDTYVLDSGIYRPQTGVAHREEEYDSAGFDTLRTMQERHFWYRGRHRFLRHAFGTTLRRENRQTGDLRMIDLGGGCGGWVKYLIDGDIRGSEIALGDSSLRALDYASQMLPPSVNRYQIDILHLDWQNRWDVVFLLDVLEHIPEDTKALQQIHEALSPGGLLFITTPALQCFWTYNDELAHHVRRYSRKDFNRLATASGFELLDARYFMFFLSPLLLASRWLSRPDLQRLSDDERQLLLARTHRVPNTFVNGALTALFSAETPLGHWLPFPWGTSILTVYRKAV